MFAHDLSGDVSIAGLRVEKLKLESGALSTASLPFEVVSLALDELSIDWPTLSTPCYLRVAGLRVSLQERAMPQASAWHRMLVMSNGCHALW